MAGVPRSVARTFGLSISSRATALRGSSEIGPHPIKPKGNVMRYRLEIDTEKIPATGDLHAELLAALTSFVAEFAHLRGSGPQSAFVQAATALACSGDYSKVVGTSAVFEGATCAECSAECPSKVLRFFSKRETAARVTLFVTELGRVSWTRGVDGKLWCERCIGLVRQDDTDGSLSRMHRDLLGSGAAPR